MLFVLVVFLSLPWPIVRQRAPDLEGTQIRSAAGEIIIHSRQASAGIHGGRAGAKLEVEIRRFVECSWIGTRSRDFREDVIVDENAVFILAGRIAEFLQGFESSYFPRFGLELSLLLG